MTIPPKAFDFARSLHAHESVARNTSVPPGSSATLRVYEKLYQHLGTVVGVGGFQSLATRALTLAKSEALGLSAVQVGADGRIQGLGELKLKTEKPETEEAGVIFLARLFGLLLVFIGDALTLRLVQDVWPDLDFEIAVVMGEKREHTR